MKGLREIFRTSFPQYKERYVFTAKLRFVLYLGFLAFYIYFFYEVLSQTKFISGTIVFFSLMAALSYYNVIHQRLVRLSLIIELLSDLAMITVIIYLSGGPYSSYFTLYIFYCLIGGIFYNHYVTAFLGVCSSLIFGLFLFLCRWGVVPPLILNYGAGLPIAGYTPIAHFFFAMIFIVLTVYTVKIASQFSQRREKMLELRNKELIALNIMSSTIRSAGALRKVIGQVLAGIKEGLGFETAVLILFDYDAKRIRFFSMHEHPRLKEIEDLLGGNIDDITFPLEMISAPIFSQILDKKILFRRKIEELVVGLDAYIPKEKLEDIQEILKVKRIVAVPLVAGERVMGGMIGFCKDEFVDQQIVSTMEAFANQAALSIESALLIERLRRTNDELQRANRVKTEFLATMSHELRTPLTAIMGYTELLIEGMMGELKEDQKQSLKDVLHNAQDLLELINNLLDLSRIDSGKMPLERRPFEIGEMLERLHRRILPLLQKKRHNLAIIVQENLPPVVGDERKLQQVILNLLSNANKFTPDGGKITVSVAFFEKIKSAPWHDRIIDKMREPFEEAIEICITDTGIGIREDELENIFNMFHQIESGVTRSFSGTGLGLALAKKMVELHGGAIWAQSIEGKGSEFYVVLPHHNSV